MLLGRNTISPTVQFNFNLAFKYTILECPLIFMCYSWVAHMSFYTRLKWYSYQCMRITQSNLVNVSLVTNIHKSLKILLILYNICTSINGIDDISIENSSMATLSMEHRKRIITIHNNYTVSLVIQTAVSILLDTRNAATTY